MEFAFDTAVIFHLLLVYLATKALLVSSSSSLPFHRCLSFHLLKVFDSSRPDLDLGS